MNAMAAVPILDLHGTHRELGRQHGRAQRARIQAFLGDRLARINAVLPQPTSLAALAPSLRHWRAAIGDTAPQLLGEIDGLAEGADIARDEALLLQLRRELTGYRRIETAGDCSTLVHDSASGRLLAQNVDLNGAMAPELALLRIAHCGRRVLMLSFTGLLGYLGLNDRGLAVGLNLLLAGDWRPGVPGYLAIRHLLDEADDVDQALALLRRLPLASSRSFTLCDARRSVAVECLPGGVVHELPAGERAHTNHFLLPSLAPQDQINPFARTSSLRRLEACRRWLSAHGPEAGAPELFALLGEAPLFVPDSPDPRRECTVATVVMNPARVELQVRAGASPSVVTLALAPSTLASNPRRDPCPTS